MAPRVKAKPKRIRKAWQKGLASIPGIDGKRKRVEDDYPITEIPFARNEQRDVTADDVNQLAKVLGDDKLAALLRKMQKEKYPYATLLELVFMEYMDRNRIEYIYQAFLYGGYRTGGAVPDFALKRVGGWLAVNCMGTYWHNLPGKQAKDEAQRILMIGSIFQGMPILNVVYLWERNAMQPNPVRERVFEDTIAGIEHPA